ncbi:hypothetical protein [uncultured Desulfuromonas sp.]|uniref:hypothetical protein n=1 Tax=uncultured Desulfuromonas sp. TaxID=181013 RepID=UPI002AAC1E47|nr:hypothetical protein [uncultured Desulfuromonas sp.]
MKVYRHWISLTVLLLMLSGCASILHSPTNKLALQKRIQWTMEARIAGQWGLVYDTFWQSYRDQITRESFLTRSRVSFKSYRIESVTLSEGGKSAEAKVWSSIEMRGFTFPEALQTQEWLYENGNWYQKVEPDGMQKALL